MLRDFQGEKYERLGERVFGKLLQLNKLLGKHGDFRNEIPWVQQGSNRGGNPIF
jgi:hypothetical protein